MSRVVTTLSCSVLLGLMANAATVEASCRRSATYRPPTHQQSIHHHQQYHLVHPTPTCTSGGAYVYPLGYPHATHYSYPVTGGQPIPGNLQGAPAGFPVQPGQPMGQPFPQSQFPQGQVTAGPFPQSQFPAGPITEQSTAPPVPGAGGPTFGSPMGQTSSTHFPGSEPAPMFPVSTPTGGVPVAPMPTAPEMNRFPVVMGQPLRLTAPGNGATPGSALLAVGGFQMPVTVSIWEEGRIELQLPSLNFQGEMEASLLIFNSQQQLLVELPVMLTMNAPSANP